MFNKEWELQFFVMLDNGNTVISTIIKNAIKKRHYDVARKNNKYAKLKGENKKVVVIKLNDRKQK